MAASGSIQGQAHAVADAVLLEQTSDIHARRGTRSVCVSAFPENPPGRQSPLELSAFTRSSLTLRQGIRAKWRGGPVLA
jgi:hypothetical protein